MAQTPERLMVDCSVVVKWKLVAEDYAGEAEELLSDWQNQIVDLCAPNLLQSEVMSAFGDFITRSIRMSLLFVGSVITNESDCDLNSPSALLPIPASPA